MVTCCPNVTFSTTVNTTGSFQMARPLARRESSWLGLTSVSNPEDTTYHFPPNALDLTDFMTGPNGSTECTFTFYGGDGSGSQTDSYYESVSSGGEVGKVACMDQRSSRYVNML